jgi:beta-glucosidase
MARRLRKPIFILLVFPIFLACAQAQTSSTDVDLRVDSLLKKLTLEEKLDLIGGVDDFYIRANEKIGLPRLKMADGPVGVVQRC